jgi:DNA-binding CsgD family transcriptional regulator
LAASADSNGWAYRYRLPLVIALAMSGLSVDARALLDALEKQRHPSRQHVDYERGLAQAWVAAASGAVSKGAALALSAAEKARAGGQFAAEVLCLQAAAQFGDGSGAPRLRKLERIVEGHRVALAARLATAVAAHDGAGLADVSAEFERIGDLGAALDAAARAAIAYRRSGLRGTALRYSARAEDLAQQCGGACTSALRQAVERLPLSEREREIVMLIGEGLSNRAIAERLTLSVRTVEGHIYRAMSRTGTARREELSELLPRRRRAASR